MRCRVPRLWVILCYFPRQQAGSWMGSGVAGTQNMDWRPYGMAALQVKAEVTLPWCWLPTLDHLEQWLSKHNSISLSWDLLSYKVGPSNLHSSASQMTPFIVSFREPLCWLKGDPVAACHGGETTLSSGKESAVKGPARPRG